MSTMKRKRNYAFNLSVPISLCMKVCIMRTELDYKSVLLQKFYKSVIILEILETVYKYNLLL